MTHTTLTRILLGALLGASGQVALGQGLRESILAGVEWPELPAGPAGLLLVQLVPGEHPEAGAWFAARVSTTLPDGVDLELSLAYLGQRGPTGRAEVRSGAAEALLGPFGGRRVLAGEYRLTVRYESGRQAPALAAALAPFPRSARGSFDLRVGDRARRDEETRAGRERLQALHERIEALWREQAGAALRARAGEDFVVGAEGGDFDAKRWQRFVADWRGRLQAVESDLDEVNARSTLFPRYPAAYSILKELAQIALQSAQASTREVYAHHGRAVPLEDRASDQALEARQIDPIFQARSDDFRRFRW